MHSVENANMYHVSKMTTIPWTPGGLSNIYLCNHEIESIKVICILMERYNHNRMASRTNEVKWASLIGVSHCGNGPHGNDLITRVAHTYHGMELNLNQGVSVFVCYSSPILATYLDTRWVGCVLHRDQLWLRPSQTKIRMNWWGVGERGSRASLTRVGAPYVGSGGRHLLDQPPSGKEDNMPGMT